MHPRNALAAGLGAALIALPAQAEPTVPAPGLSLSGYTRVRAASNFDFDLNAATPQDAWTFLTDIRSYLTLDARWEGLRLVSSADLAGTDFDKGAVMGFDNPARQRPIALGLRQLFLDYTCEPLGVEAIVGRQPARLGYGIVSAINRDGFKLIKRLPDLGSLTAANLTAAAVRGAKGNTLWSDTTIAPPGVTTTPGRSATTVVNDPNGAAHDLSTYVLAFNAVPCPKGRLQAFVVQQIDSSEAGVYPSKRYLDVNGEAPLGDLKLGGEAIYLAGLGPQAKGTRATLDSFLLLGTASYPVGPVELAFTAARGGGDNDPGDGVNTGFQALFIDETSFTYNTVFSDELYGYDGTDAAVGRGTGLNNVTFLQPSVTWRPLPGLALGAAYTLHLATAPQRAGAGPLGTVPTASSALATRIGDEVDLKAGYTFGVTTLYALAGTFVPGDVYAYPGFANAAHKVELGTEVKF